MDPCGITSIESVSEMYRKEFPDSENELFKAEIGKQIKIVFPQAEKYRTKLEGKDKREWTYKGISVMTRTNSDITTAFDFNDFWTKIRSLFAKVLNWTLESNIDSGTTSNLNDPQSYTWFSVIDNDKLDGNRIVRELTIFKDLSYTFTICGRKVNQYMVPVCLNSSSPDFNRLFKSLFEFCGTVRICKGFEVETDAPTYNQKAEITGTAERWQYRNEFGDFNDQRRHRSLSCDVVLMTTSKQQKMCNKCSTIKHNSFYKTLNPEKKTNLTSPSKKKFKRESYMSPEELQTKLQEEKRKRKNAEQREQCLRDKIYSGMQCFDEADNEDFRTMFDMIDENQLNPDMKLFFEVQKENIGKKSSKGYRWHPK